MNWLHCTLIASLKATKNSPLVYELEALSFWGARVSFTVVTVSQLSQHLPECADLRRLWYLCISVSAPPLPPVIICVKCWRACSRSALRNSVFLRWLQPAT